MPEGYLQRLESQIRTDEDTAWAAQQRLARPGPRELRLIAEFAITKAELGAQERLIATERAKRGAIEIVRDPAKPKYYTPAEIAGLSADEPDWIIKCYIAKGAITELNGKVKAAGKTTLAQDMIASILGGQNWAGPV